MNRTPRGNRRRLATLCLIGLILAVVRSLYAQPLAYQLDSEQVIAPATPAGRPQLQVTFSTNGSATGNERLLLRFSPPEAINVISASLTPAGDSTPVTITPVPEGVELAWGQLPAEEYVLTTEVSVDSTLDTAAGPVWVFVDADGQSIGDARPLSAASIAALNQAAGVPGAEEGTPTPNATTTLAAATAAGTAAVQTQVAEANAALQTRNAAIAAGTTVAIQTGTAAAHATGTAAAAPPTAQPSPSATLAPGGLLDSGLLDSGLLVPILLTALFIIAAAIIGLLFLRRRPSQRPVAPSPRPTTQQLTGPESVTTVLTRNQVFLQLESDPARTFELGDQPFAIGRAPTNNLVIDESFPQWQTASREHAIILPHPQGYIIEDRGSQNGVRVNGRLTPKNLLRHGWQVSIGGVAFRFVDESQSN